MNKYMILFISVLFVLFITIIANQMETYANIKNVAEERTSEIDISVGGVKGLMGTYIDLITFDIPNFPNILNILIFYPINIVMIYMILEIFKDLIPFT